MNDSATGYGWVSITLHWVTAVLILYLLFLGSSISTLEGVARTEAVKQHTSLAIASYLVILARIVWRWLQGHPGPLPEQRGWAFSLGRLTHYAMLVALALMLISGPVMQFAYGRDIEVYTWFVIPSPIEASPGLAGLLHRVHATSALFIFIAVLLHIGGVYKHTAFNQDGTLTKIFMPGRQSPAEQQADTEIDDQRGES